MNFFYSYKTELIKTKTDEDQQVQEGESGWIEKETI